MGMKLNLFRPKPKPLVFKEPPPKGKCGSCTRWIRTSPVPERLAGRGLHWCAHPGGYHGYTPADASCGAYIQEKGVTRYKPD